jgi:hypothetical protein
VDTAEVVPSHITYANVPAKEIEHQRRQSTVPQLWRATGGGRTGVVDSGDTD